MSVVFSETTRPMEIKFHMITPYDWLAKFDTKGGFQICPRMDFDNILYVEYLRYNNYKNEIISFLEGC